MSRRRYKVSAAALLPLIVLSGLLAPGPAAQPEIPPVLMSLVATSAAVAGTTCHTVRRELRFGWIETGDEAAMTAPLPRTGMPVCLAVYRVGSDH